MCAHASDLVIHSCAHSRASLHDSRRVTRRRTAALQPRAADRAHPAHRTRDRPFYADDSIVERLQANRARAGASQHLQLRKTTHQVVSELGAGCGRAEAPTRRRLSRTSRPKSAGFCLHCTDSDSEHSISGSGILGLNPGIPARQQQIARPRSVGIEILCYDLLFLGVDWSCMLRDCAGDPKSA